MLADQLDFVIGVDTHRDRHALALLRSDGAGLGERELEASLRGYAQALAFARAQASGRRAWAIEGSGCYGKGLARFLAAAGELVLEVERPKREGRRGRLKSDALDALRAARLALAGEELARPREGGSREALRCLLRTRASALSARTAALNQLLALLVGCPEPLREELRSLSRARLLSRLLALRPQRRQQPELRGTLLALRRSPTGSWR